MGQHMERPLCLACLKNSEEEQGESVGDGFTQVMRDEGQTLQGFGNSIQINGPQSVVSEPPQIH